MTEAHLKALKVLDETPAISQRGIAKRLKLSLGKANYIVNSLIEKGYVKAKRFKNSNNKLAYMYVLTPNGIKKKVELTRAFLSRKSDEYRMLHREIKELKEEMRKLEGNGDG